MPCILEQDESSKDHRKNWAGVIRQICEVALLPCPKCSGKMKAISVIEDQNVIKKIPEHLGLREVKPRSPLRMAEKQFLHTKPHADYFNQHS